MTRPTPKHQAPALNISLLDNKEWKLSEQNPENFSLIVFYRGLHCPLCKKYLQQLRDLAPDFKEKGVNVVAISMDNEARARLSRKDWELEGLPLGYGLDLEAAKKWGLYISHAIKDGEPDIFSEPGLFLINNNSEVYYSAINSNPWGRALPSLICKCSRVYCQFRIPR